MAIESFACRGTKDLFCLGVESAKIHIYGWCEVASVAYRKLDMLNAAKSLMDLKSPPSNKLETLKHELTGQYAIRINDRWRVCFKWNKEKGGAYDVYITDYH